MIKPPIKKGAALTAALMALTACAQGSDTPNAQGEATAEFSTDEYYDKWFEDISNQVNALSA